MRVAHLMASPFYGGPERQVLGLARHLPAGVTTSFLSFAEGGRADAFLAEARRHGFGSRPLAGNTPRFAACVAEVASHLRELRADVLCCSGYKPDLVGWRAARRAGIPVVSIVHGWTAATWKVRVYEQLDRLALRWLDAAVCVSHAQASDLRRAKVPGHKVAVIHNAIGAEAFGQPDPALRQEMLAWFPKPPRWLIGAAGRFSPEKGYSIFLEAAAQVASSFPEAGFVLFGSGPLREELERAVVQKGLEGRCVLAGFRTDLSRYLPNLDVHAMSSFTEGLPVILLEASAAGVPTVATSVGGIPELIAHGESGYLVPPGNASALAEWIAELLASREQRRAMGDAARQRVRQDFAFPAMARRYHELFASVLSRR